MQATQDLIERAQADDLDAFGEVVLLHQSAVRGYLAVRMNNPAEVDDLAQEVFITAFRRLRTFDLSKPIGPWLRGIAMNLLRNHLRKRVDTAVGGEPELDSIINAQIEEEETSHGGSRVLEALRRCVSAAGEKARELLRWRYADEMHMADITRRLGCKHSAATMKLARIRRQLKTCVETHLAREV